MIEIVFGDSAYGSLNVAQSYGKGKYHGGVVSVFLRKKNGIEPTAEEIEIAQKQAEEKARQDWENAIPLGSSREDLYCFPLALSVGAISEKGVGTQRKSALELLFSIYNKKGELSKAISFYSKAIKLTPDDPDIYCNRGSCYDDQGKYDLALADYSTAIEIDEDCKQAYINRSITYSKLLDKENDAERKNEYYDLLIADLNKALELDPEDLFVKNMLVRRLRTKIDAERKIADIDERIGDLEVKDGHLFEAFKYYIDSARYYLIEVLIHEKDCWEAVERLISKIHGISGKEIISQIDSIETELSKFCQLLRGIAVQLYAKGKKDIAEKGFLILLNYDTDKDCALNLAFMKRRGETCLTEYTTFDLLNQCSNKNNAIWCVNKALCYVTGVEGHDINWDEAMNVIRSAQDNMGEAVQWWSDVEVAGEAENNMVMVFLNLAEKYSTKDHLSLEDRICQARKDGYHIPENL